MGRRTFAKKAAAIGAALLGTAALGEERKEKTDRIVKMMQPLFSPLHLGQLKLANRFAMAPMAIGKFPGGIPSSEAIDFYLQRASGGTGLIITGGTIVDHPLGSSDKLVGRMTPATVDAWKPVTERVHRHPTAIFCQLWHQGMQTAPGIGPHSVVHNGIEKVKQATHQDLQSVIDAFVRSAALAAKAGFDGIEIHGAHGYLLDSYLREPGIAEAGSSVLTGRTFVYQLVSAIRSSLGAKVPICFRFSRWTVDTSAADHLKTPEALQAMLLLLKQAGITLFHASRGFNPFWPPEYENSPLTLAGWTKKFSSMPAITVGQIGRKAQEFFGDQKGGVTSLCSQFDEGQFDLAAMGRSLLGDPLFCRKAKDGAFDRIIAQS